MDKREELYKLIQMRDAQRQKNIQKRALRTIAFFAVLFFALFYMQGNINGIADILATIVASIASACVYFGVNAIIFTHLIEASRNEQNAIDRLKKQYDEL